jgi:riboflavin kinase/FMN adenylyltransferase
MVVIAFDHAFAAHSAQHFIDDVLLGRLDAQRVAVGENFRFGHKAQGDTELLRGDGRFALAVEPLLEVDGEVVSSSHIRGLVLGGAVEYAGRLLGAPFALGGPVVTGDQRGRELGFPTANLVPPDGYIAPGHGVYAARVRVPGEPPRAGAVNVGVRPQFETGRGELIEAYLIDWEGDLYGQEIRIEFLKRLRGERRFSSVEALVEQMGRDVDAARAIVA